MTVRELLKAQEEAASVLNQILAPLQIEMDSVWRDFSTKIEKSPTEYISVLTDLKGRIQSGTASAMSISQKRPIYHDEMRALLNLDEFSQVTPELDAAIKAVQSLPDKPEPKTIDLVRPQFYAWRTAIEKWEKWISGISFRIVQMTDNLRRNGITSVEK